MISGPKGEADQKKSCRHTVQNANGGQRSSFIKIIGIIFSFLIFFASSDSCTFLAIPNRLLFLARRLQLEIILDRLMLFSNLNDYVLSTQEIIFDVCCFLVLIENNSNI